MSGVAAMLAAGRIEELISSSPPSAASWWRWSSIEEDLRQISSELRSIGAAIDHGERRGGTYERVGILIRDISRVVSDLEDAMDDIEDLREPMRKRRHYSSSSSSSKLLRLLPGLAKYAPSFYHQLRTRHKIAGQIHDIGYRLRKIWERGQDFELAAVDVGRRAPRAGFATALMPMMEDIFGRERERHDLIEQLLVGGEDGGRKTISVVGMGGLGKTTLVRMVFEDERVRAQFHPRDRIWVSVSHQFEADDTYRSMLKQLGDDDDDAAAPRSDGDQKSQDQLVRRLHDKLQDKRYLVVLDDVWSTDAAKKLVSALPLPRQVGAVLMGSGSRVVVTTRKESVAEAGGSHFILHLKPLSMLESWVLFRETAFSDMLGVCPPELVPIAEEIVNRCRGSPAAIKLYGNLLRGRERSLEEWKSFLYSTARSEGAVADDRLMNVLLLSFYELHPLVKPCLLYLALFPKGCSLKCAKIARLWLAEGFITKADGEDPDEIAEGCLLELAQRSLIQADKFDSSGRMLRFRVRDMIHDAIRYIVRELNFFSSAGGGDALLFGSPPRRLAANGLGVLESMASQHHSSLRSLILSAGVTEFPLPSSFTRLKVLHLKGMQLASFPLGILKLFHLKYLHLRKTIIRELPEDIWRLQNLQTLDLKRSPITKLPEGIVKLRHLRHLLVYEQVYLGVECPKGMDTLASLEKLSNLNITRGREQLEELSRMTKLKRLGITYVSSENGAALCQSISMLSHLQSLYLYSGDDHHHQPLKVETLSTASTSLRSINLRGPLSSLPNLDSPTFASLTKVRLNFSKLLTNPFTSLQHNLHNLVELYLHNDAYRGDELRAQGGGFGKLRKLYVQNLSILRRVVIDQGAMVNLEYLELIECKKLETVPTGIEHLTHLKEFYIGMVHDSCIEGIRTTDRRQVEHIPVIREIFRERERLYRRPL